VVVEQAPKEGGNSTTVVVEGGNIENKAFLKKEIENLRDEIEEIKLADSKLLDAELRGIPKGAIADNVSFGGLSIQERKEKIQQLKDALQHSSGKKHWWQKAAVVTGFLFGGLLASKEVKGQATEKKEKGKIETVSHSKEKQKEDFLKYVDFLKEKNDTTQVTPEDMDLFLVKWNLGGKGLDTTSEEKKKEVLRAIYEKASPYSAGGKKIQIPDLVPGYDLEFGHNKEERALLNKILSIVDFDIKGGMTTYEDLPGFGKVLMEYDIDFQKDFGDKKIKGGFTHAGMMSMLNIQIVDKVTSRVIAETVISGREGKEINHTHFITELNTLILGK
jgi:hypothetical protein